jgi:hypothetical protein
LIILLVCCQCKKPWPVARWIRLSLKRLLLFRDSFRGFRAVVLPLCVRSGR